MILEMGLEGQRHRGGGGDGGVVVAVEGRVGKDRRGAFRTGGWVEEI